MAVTHETKAGTGDDSAKILTLFDPSFEADTIRAFLNFAKTGRRAVKRDWYISRVRRVLEFADKYDCAPLLDHLILWLKHAIETGQTSPLRGFLVGARLNNAKLCKVALEHGDGILNDPENGETESVTDAEKEDDDEEDEEDTDEEDNTDIDEEDAEDPADPACKTYLFKQSAFEPRAMSLVDYRKVPTNMMWALTGAWFDGCDWEPQLAEVAKNFARNIRTVENTKKKPAKGASKRKAPAS
ncbi:hypothetical protein Q5752_001284 [Cryptotrichosporon argae]